MGQTNIRIDPLSTSCVLRQLGMAIDEIKLVRSIDSLSEQMHLHRGYDLDSGRKKYLISELRFLNKRLNALREKADSEE